MQSALSRIRQLLTPAPALAVGLGIAAYRPLLTNSIRVPEGYEVERWFFAPDEKTPVLVAAAAGWLLWRRRPRLLALPPRRDAVLGGALLAIGSALFLWAYLSRAADLLLPALAAHGLGFACLTRGRAGARVALLPALALLLAVPIPAPLRDELVWRLQLWSASAAAWLMTAVGLDVTLGGIRFRHGGETFAVIEACSGLRGIENLILIALLVRELFADAGRRLWLLLPIAPLLGFGINVLRIVFIAMSDDPQALAGSADHTGQGIAGILVGTTLLYGLGSALAAFGSQRAADPGRGALRAGAGPAAWRAAAIGLAALLLLSLVLPPLSRPATGTPPAIAFPTELEGWTSREVKIDPHFLGSLPFRRFFHRRYEKPAQGGPPQVVFAFVGWDVPESPLTSRLFTSKLSWPGAAFSLQESRPIRLWTLGVDAVLSTAAASPSERVVVYRWALRDRGLWRETLRSLLALESGPLRREQERVAVRLTSPIHPNWATSRTLAQKTLELFIHDFREELDRL